MDRSDGPDFPFISRRPNPLPDRKPCKLCATATESICRLLTRPTDVHRVLLRWKPKSFRNVSHAQEQAENSSYGSVAPARTVGGATARSETASWPAFVTDSPLRSRKPLSCSTRTKMAWVYCDMLRISLKASAGHRLPRIEGRDAGSGFRPEEGRSAQDHAGPRQARDSEDGVRRVHAPQWVSNCSPRIRLTEVSSQ
jgi:hypothetical protein